jgi:beta-lactamase class A
MVKLLILAGLLLAGEKEYDPAISTSTGTDWIPELEKRLSGIENSLDGSFGIYIKHLGDNRSLGHNTDRPWYLASTTKIPIAVAVLRKTETGEISLDDELILSESDFVDGAGDILRQKPGTAYKISVLLEKMIQDSDNSATDMLFRLIGEEELNQVVRETMVAEGFNRITSILQVRHDAFSEFHENARNLSNLDILFVNSSRCRDERMSRLANRLAINANELRAGSIVEAFERYYQRHLNSGNLEAMGLLLERLYRGELLSQENTRYLLDVMAGVRTGDRRIKAGLSSGYRFYHKTGTQINRTVHVGIIHPVEGSHGHPVIVAACVNSSSLADAERALMQIGRALSEVMNAGLPTATTPGNTSLP